MSRMQQRRHGKTQIVSMSVLEECQKSDPRGIEKMEAKNMDIKERLQVAAATRDASFE